VDPRSARGILGDLGRQHGAHAGGPPISHNVVMSRLTGGLVAGVILALAVASGASATFSGENGRVFYVVGAFTTSSTILSACPADGGHVKNVMQLASWPAPSPDGTKIAYVKLKAADASNDGIWVANADGTDPVEIVDESLSPIGPAWSPGGTKLTFRQYVEYPGIPFPTFSLQPVVADVATKVVTPLLGNKDVDSNTAQSTPNAWTADGSQIYFPAHVVGGGDDDLYRVPATGGTATRILGTDARLPFFQWIDIAPDNTSMMVQRQYDDGTPENGFDALFETRRYDLSGGGGTLIGSFLSASGGNEAFRYSPDGTRVVFNTQPAGAIKTADLNGAGAVPLGVSGAFPVWSTNVDDCTGPGAATMRINEVGLGDAPFIELLDPADETFPSDQGPYKVVVFDGAGARTGAHIVSSSLLQGRDNTQPLLISSAGANSAYGVTGDEALSVGLPTPGQACFTRGVGETKVNCVSWGCVVTAVSPSSTRIPAPGSGTSVQRQGIGSTTFQVGAPTPKATNVGGTTASPCGSPGVPPAGGSGAPPAAAPAGAGGAGGGGGAGAAKRPVLTVKGGSVLTVKRGVVSVKLGCAAGGVACNGRAALSVGGSGAGAGTSAAKSVALGSAAVKIAAGKTATVRLKLNGAGKKLLKKSRRVKARLSVTVTGAGPVKRSVVLKRAG
jgi:hypothetical protein